MACGTSISVNSPCTAVTGCEVDWTTVQTWTNESLLLLTTTLRRQRVIPTCVLIVGVTKSTWAAEGGKGASNCVKHLLSNSVITMIVFGWAEHLTEAMHATVLAYMWLHVHPHNTIDSGIRQQMFRICNWNWILLHCLQQLMHSWCHGHCRWCGTSYSYYRAYIGSHHMHASDIVPVFHVLPMQHGRIESSALIDKQWPTELVHNSAPCDFAARAIAIETPPMPPSAYPHALRTPFNSPITWWSRTYLPRIALLQTGTVFWTSQLLFCLLIPIPIIFL